jgi:hypothetical protein
MNIADKCSILAGVASANDSVFITVMNDALAEQRRQHAIPLSLKKDAWSSIACEPVLPWIVAGITAIDQRSPRIVIVGWGGQVSLIDRDTCHREGIQRKDSKDVSIVRSVAAIGDVVYAAGMRRQVYRRIGTNSWGEIDRDVAYEGDRIDVGFNTIGGFDRAEVYAAGLNGEIWHYDDRQWREIQSPTNVHLHSMCCVSNDSVYIGGRAGILLRGRHDSWEVLKTGIGETIWDIHWFLDKLYVVTNKGVFIYIDGELEQIKNDLLLYGDFLRFSSSRDKLWIFGRKRIVQFDGLLWHEQSSTLSDAETSSPVLRFFTDDVLSLGSDYLEA